MHAERTAGGATATWVAGALAILAVDVSYFTTLGRLENDHFVIIARARQLLDGDWPARDFIDPGMPLTYLPSAAAAAIGGPTLLAEVVLGLALLGLTTGLAFFMVRRTTGSVALALAGAALIFAFPTRLYSATKVAAICIAYLLGSSYARRPTRHRLLWFGAWTGLAFLVRVDYAVYIGGAAMALFALDSGGIRRQLIAVGLFFSIALVVIMPWFVYVHLVQGLPEYLASAVRFAEQERARTAGGLPWFDWPVIQTSNQGPALFYLLLSVPAAGLVLTARMPVSRARTEMAYASALTLLCGVAFLRDEVINRIGDVIPQIVIMAGYVAARLPRPALAPLGVATATVSAMLGIQAYLQQGGSLAPAEIGRQVSDMAGRLGRSDPELASDPLFVDAASYIARCTGPDERVIVSGFAPEIPVLADRKFAGGLPAWLLGYYVLPPDARIIERHLAREKVGAVVLLEGARVFVVSWPGVARRLVDGGFKEYGLPVEEPAIHLWLRPPADPASTDAATGLPCRPAS